MHYETKIAKNKFKFKQLQKNIPNMSYEEFYDKVADVLINCFKIYDENRDRINGKKDIELSAREEKIKDAEEIMHDKGNNPLCLRKYLLVGSNIDLGDYYPLYNNIRKKRWDKISYFLPYYKGVKIYRYSTATNPRVAEIYKTYMPNCCQFETSGNINITDDIK